MPPNNAAQQRQRRRDQEIRERIGRKLGGTVPKYNFYMERIVTFINMSVMMHQGKATTDSPQKPSNHFWEANLHGAHVWASAGIDLGIIQASATRELFVGVPVSASGKQLNMPYAVVRHWKGASRANALSLAQYASARDLATAAAEIRKEWKETMVQGLRGLKSFGAQQAVLTSQPLPNDKTEALAVIVSGRGWAEENTNAHNTAVPTNMTIEYVDLVFSLELLKFYESLYLFDIMLNNLKGGNMKKITLGELRLVLKQNPRRSPHPYMNEWYEFARLWQLADRTRPLPDPRAPNFRFQLDRHKMHSLYHRVMAYSR
jgi:hypothetical protein